MDRFFVITNEDRDKGSEKAIQITQYLRSKGKSCDYVAIERDSDPGSEEIRKIREMPNDTQAVLVLGGDGTFIQAAGLLAPKRIPMIGVNLGHLGYLAEVDKENITPAIDRLIADDIVMEERMMLSGTPVIDGASGNGRYAFNDIVAKTSGSSVGLFDIEVN